MNLAFTNADAEQDTTAHTAYCDLASRGADCGGAVGWGGVGSLSAWVLSNIPLFNQAYCWLALRYTVMRYFFHTLDFALETQGSNKFTVVSDMQFCFLFLFLFLFDPRGETDLTAALLF